MVDTIHIEEFNEISIRARFAYGACCLENALIHYKKNIEQWKSLLLFMWKYPSDNGMFTEWPNKMVYFRPNFILKYDYKERDEITRTEYDFYKELYLSTEEPILHIIDLLGSISRKELYIKMPKWSPDTLNLLKQIIELMYNNGIDLPDVKPFKQYKFDYLSGNGIDYLYYGWGDTFDGKEYSKFLNGHTLTDNFKRAEAIRIEEFKEISIRARFAYGVCCLENALVNYDKNIAHWKNLLAFMWGYPAVTGMLNEWPDKMVYFEPSTILKYGYEEVDEITRAEYDFYKELYMCTEEPVLHIIDLLGSIPREELYIGMPTWSPDTLNLLKQIIEIMCNNGIELPDIKPFKQYKFDYLSGNDIDYLYYGWGETFDGKQYSKFLKS